jgi:hypothetical protein
MSKWQEQEENVKFVAFGKENAKEGSYVVEEGETLEGVIERIKDSTKGYGKIYQLRTKGVEEALIICGKTDLNNKFGYGNTAVMPISEGDEVRITYTGMKPTKKGKPMYTLKVLVKRL